jgi:hypothetical protein
MTVNINIQIGAAISYGDKNPANDWTTPRCGEALPRDAAHKNVNMA